MATRPSSRVPPAGAPTRPLAAASAVLLIALLAAPAIAQDRQLELGIEGFVYESATTALNRDNVLGLDRYPGIERLAVGWKEAHGGFRTVFRGYVGRSWGRRRNESDWVVRQGYVQYWWGETLGVRLGKQRVAWGSGLAWNPTNRLEPPKNALNTALEQEGALAARVDWTPRPWASLVLVAASTDAAPRDLPLGSPAIERRSAAVRARFVVKDTDLAFVGSSGKNQRTLCGLDLGRDLAGVATLHAEAAVYRGAEMLPARAQQTFLRVAAGALRTSGENAFAVEYFYNGEGYSAGGADAWLSGLDQSWAVARDPALDPALRQAALRSYAAQATIPYAWGLGLRRHYLHVSWTRGGATSVFTGAVRSVVGLADGSVALTPGIGWAPREDLTLNVDALLLFGPADSEYRTAPVRAALQARARMLF